MKISDKIYIDIDREKTDPDILGLLTYKNPDYRMKKDLGLWVGDTPKEIRTYEIKQAESGRQLIVLRGEALRVKQYIGGFSYNFDHPDHPIKIRYINNDFPLDQHQEAAVSAMQEKMQGVVHAVTSAGKSLMILKAIATIGQRAVIVVHRKVLMKQFLEDIDKYIRDEKGNKIVPGIIGDGKFSIGDITLALDKTLARRLPEIRNSFGVAILDECHICPAATIHDTLNAINAARRYGFSGTLERKDQKQFLIFATFGQVISRITKETLLELERVVPVHPVIIETSTKFDWDGVVAGLTDVGDKNPVIKARALQEKTISLDPVRNQQILDYVANLKGKTIVLCRYVAPCFTLAERFLQATGRDAGVITGKNSKEALEAYDEMKHKDLQLIFATIGCVSTGLSISDLRHIVLISPVYSNKLLLEQIRGRLMRTSPGKEFGTLHFFWDSEIFPKWKLSRFLNIIKN